MGISAEICKKIKEMHQAGYNCKELADKFGLPESTVRVIVYK